MLHRIFLFAHVLSAFLYLLAHGGSVAVAFRVRRETSAERVRALLDLSRSTVAVANYMFLATAACGIALAFLGHWWSAGWIWLSIVILVMVLMVMGRAAAPYFRRIRGAAGPRDLCSPLIRRALDQGSAPGSTSASRIPDPLDTSARAASKRQKQLSQG